MVFNLYLEANYAVLVKIKKIRVYQLQNAN